MGSSPHLCPQWWMQPPTSHHNAPRRTNINISLHAWPQPFALPSFLLLKKKKKEEEKDMTR